MNGLSLDYKPESPFSVNLFGGGDVRYYESYDEKDLVAGGKLSGWLMEDSLKLGLSYIQKWEDSATTHQLMGLDAFYDHGVIFEAYGEYQFNYLSDTMSYLLLGLNYQKNQDWQLRTE